MILEAATPAVLPFPPVDPVRVHHPEALVGGVAMIECERCHVRTQRAVLSYWGQTLCPSCCVVVAERHDRFGSWPKQEQAS